MQSQWYWDSLNWFSSFWVQHLLITRPNGQSVGLPYQRKHWHYRFMGVWVSRTSQLKKWLLHVTTYWSKLQAFQRSTPQDSDVRSRLPQLRSIRTEHNGVATWPHAKAFYLDSPGDQKTCRKRIHPFQQALKSMAAPFSTKAFTITCFAAFQRDIKRQPSCSTANRLQMFWSNSFRSFVHSPCLMIPPRGFPQGWTGPECQRKQALLYLDLFSWSCFEVSPFWGQFTSQSLSLSPGFDHR